VKKRGILLIAVLLMITVLLIAGLGFLGRRSSQHSSAELTRLSVQARALAWVGLEQTMAKLEKDYDFPPRRALDQQEFAWTETVFDIDGTTVIGTYTARIDLRYVEPPYSILRIEATGLLGAADSPQALRTLVAEVDLEGDRSTNPRYYKIINLLEGDL
jgi:hypothetical protein